MRIVMKFGGTSIGDPQRFRNVGEIIRKHVEGNQVVVVVSALADVTDSLATVSEKARTRDNKFISDFLETLAARHQEVAQSCVKHKKIQEEALQTVKGLIEELSDILTGIHCLGEVTPRSRDYVLSFGERLSAPVLSAVLCDLGLKSRSMTGGEAGILTDANFGEARPLMKVTTQQVKQKLGPLLHENEVPVVAGFIASTQEGVITTLGRGGSDYTATILAAALEADEVWIWTDVDGLMTADPKIEPNATTIPVISFAEATEMAYFGTKAIHPRSLEPTTEKDIPVWIKNTFNPELPGTLIVKERQVKPHTIVKAISSISQVALITVSGAGMTGSPEVASKALDILAQKNINVYMISQSSSQANISLVIPEPDLHTAVNALELGLLGKGSVREISPESDVAIIAVVGAEMKGTPGVAATVFRAVADQGVNVRVIAQGSSELNISFLVKQKDVAKAVRALHREFRLNAEKEAFVIRSKE